MYLLVKFYNSNNIEEAIGYNNISFDAQVLEYVIENSPRWFDKKGEEISETIYKFVQKLIEDSNYGVRKPYNSFSVSQIDCFTILGLDNEARRTSLKVLEFNLDMPSVETMPLGHNISEISQEQIKLVESYCMNDIICTDNVYELILGNTSHPIHRGNNLLELRQSIKDEYGLDCMNYSDIKIGDELMKLTYAREIKKPVYELPRKGTFRKSIKLSDCIPSYISFNTPILKNLLKELKSTTLTFHSEWEKTFKINGTEYVQGLGGLHSANKNEIYKANEEYTIITSDVGSMYPASIVNNGYYPAHLGKELLKTYESLYRKRIELKPQAKTDKKAKGIVDALKLTLNSFFGKLGSMESWTYDKKTLLSVTLTGQYSLLMLIEELEERGFRVLVANTDGIEVLVPLNRKHTYFEICEKWEKTTNYMLEHDEYTHMYMQNVNNYLAITSSGKIKKKGVFLTELDLWKNKSYNIRAKALEQYFVNNTSPEEFIRNHKDIKDFFIRAKANASASIVLVYDDGRQEDKGSLVRYYLSSDPADPQIFKHFHDKDKMNNESAPNELGVRRVKCFNKMEELSDYKIDYNQYIFETYRIISMIERNKKDQAFLRSVMNTNQLELF